MARSISKLISGICAARISGRGAAVLIAGFALVLAAWFTRQRDIAWLALACWTLVLFSIIWALLPLGHITVGRRGQQTIFLGQQAQIDLLLKTKRPSRLARFEEVIPANLGSRPRFSVVTGKTEKISYQITGTRRGIWQLGPLLVRTEDPFGLARVDRAIAQVSQVIVTPHIFELPYLRFGSTGLNEAATHSRLAGLVGTDDVLVRDYRPGDEIRRVHWRSTAKTGNLMVRKEEHAWDPSATILFDNRATSYEGDFELQAFEFGISLAASISLQLFNQGFRLCGFDAENEIFSDSQGAMLNSRMQILRAFSVISVSNKQQFSPAVSLITKNLVIGVFARLSEQDLADLTGSGIALVVDIDSFTSPQQNALSHSESAQILADRLKDKGWAAIIIDANSDLNLIWQHLAGIS